MARSIEAGWVERQRDPNDRRVVLVGVSSEGERILNEVRQTRARILARYLARLEPAEIETLADLLSRVTETVAQQTAQTA